MASNLENDDDHGPEDEAGEDRPILSATRLVEGVRDLLLVWFKQAHLQKPWPQMSEGDQRTWINRIEERAELLIDEVIEHVNHGDFPVVNAKIDSFTVKNGEVKVVTKGFADNDMLAILNSAGEKRVQITVMRNDQFDEERDPLHPDPDQPGLPGVKMGDAPGFEDGDGGPAVEEPPIENPPGEAAAGEEILKPKSDWWRGGFNSRMGAHKRDDNPFDDKTEGQARDDWFDGWDAADFDATAPKLGGTPIGAVTDEAEADKPAEPVADPKPKKVTKPKKAGPVVEPDIAAEDVLPIPDRKPEEQQTDGDAAQNGAEAITDNTGTVIESVDQAHAFGVWCRKDGKGTGANPFPVTSDLGKAWLRGYSDERRAEQNRPAGEEF
jgi:hypothetical protein